MKVIITLFLIFFFQASILIHAKFLIDYISEKTTRAFKGFIVTVFTNIFFGMTLAVIVMLNPEVINKLDIDFTLTLESGFIFFTMLFSKIRIGVRIVKRVRDPKNYHYNYFGKKIYNEGVVAKSEMAFYFLTMPITVIVGAYFIMKAFMN